MKNMVFSPSKRRSFKSSETRREIKLTLTIFESDTGQFRCLANSRSPICWRIFKWWGHNITLLRLGCLTSRVGSSSRIRFNVLRLSLTSWPAYLPASAWKEILDAPQTKVKTKKPILRNFLVNKLFKCIDENMSKMRLMNYNNVLFWFWTW